MHKIYFKTTFLLVSIINIEFAKIKISFQISNSCENNNPIYDSYNT